MICFPDSRATVFRLRRPPGAFARQLFPNSSEILQFPAHHNALTRLQKREDGRVDARSRRWDCVYLGVAALLVADAHEGDPVDGSQATHHSGVVQPGTVPMELHEFVADVQHYVQEGGTVGVPRHLQALHRGQPAVCLLPQLQSSAFFDI
jgi:hypothetical protein